MKLYAARYSSYNDGRDYEIALYESKNMAAYNYILRFNKYQWRKMGCRAPKKNENMAVELIVKEYSK